MHTNNYLLATLKETPTDAEIISHQLMLRAGLIRRLAAGIYSWLPLGLRVLRKVETIVREEMDNAGAQEVSMPMVQPAELWQESRRWEEYGPELLRLRDRHQRDFCLGPTHEEVITAIIKSEIRSYRQLPANFYQIQTKFRDEIRPRFGIMRGREFLMKDAYSFDIDEAGMATAYRQMYEAYARIFTRLGLEFRAVAADSGAIGGSYSHEFHVLADSGEDAIATCDQCGFSANIETLEFAAAAEAPAPGRDLQKVATPGVQTMADLCRFLKTDLQQCVKTLVVQGTEGPVALVLRGDHELNTIKAEKLEAVGKPLQFADAGSIRKACGSSAGSLGPVGQSIPVFVDHEAAALGDFSCGANEDDHHLTGVNWQRDVESYRTADLRKGTAGDPCPECKSPLLVRRGIEVGHVFQLGTKYSEAMQATCLNEDGRAVLLHMGCYGIGVSRVVAAAIEQNFDEHGIVWPDAIAPFDVCIVPIGYHKSAVVRETCERLCAELEAQGIQVLLDNRNERPGVMFADMDLIGIPHRLVVGERGINKGQIEYKGRRDQAARDLPLETLSDVLSTMRSAAVIEGYGQGQQQPRA